jgi:hypothetical protein
MHWQSEESMQKSIRNAILTLAYFFTVTRHTYNNFLRDCKTITEQSREKK